MNPKARVGSGRIMIDLRDKCSWRRSFMKCSGAALAASLIPVFASSFGDWSTLIGYERQPGLMLIECSHGRGSMSLGSNTQRLPDKDPHPPRSHDFHPRDWVELLIHGPHPNEHS